MNVKKTQKITLSGAEVIVLSDWNNNPHEILLKNRGLENEKNLQKFFEPKISDLHNPFLLPDIKPAIVRILNAIKKGEKIVIFGDYDVDGVSSTAILVKFLSEELGAKISYRLPHRAHDGYGLKSYFFDELATKWVTLVITVDCGTRDIEPIRHAKSLGIDVIVTDHHAVPETIPTEVIGIINPKRPDSNYPFSSLAGAGVAFKIIHAILLTLEKLENEKWGGKVEKTLTKYVDFASLGTVADCMPLIDENRIITTLGLKQIKNSESAGLRKFLSDRESVEWNAEIIGFQIGPRINASGRMDTPLTALRWLLASEKTCDNFLEEIEKLNSDRREIVQDFVVKALEEVDTKKPLLFFLDKDLEHGLIGLVAGKLTEQYNRPSFVLCEHHEADGSISYVASCRAPEWCNLVEILDDSKELFIRYGGHKQAAGFSVSPDNFAKLQEKMTKKFVEIYTENLPNPTIKVESILPAKNANLDFLEITDKFRPFGIGNPKPLWLLENVTISQFYFLGTEQKHVKIFIKENPNFPIIMWNSADFREHFTIGNSISLIVDFDKNIWKEKVSLQAFIKAIVV